MDNSLRIERLRADGTRLVEAAASNPEAHIPSCPGWAAADLLGHMGGVWRFLSLHVDTLASERLALPPGSEAPSGEAVVEYASSGLSELLDVLERADPTASVWTFGADKTVAFFIRRAHLETLVHRIDAERAIGSVTEVPVADASDAVDELVEMAVGRSGRPNGSLHLHQTDGEGEWMLEVVDEAIVVRRQHSKGDAAIRGTAEELMMVMWGRRSADGLELFGDRSIIEEWTSLSP